MRGRNPGARPPNESMTERNAKRRGRSAPPLDFILSARGESELTPWGVGGLIRRKLLPEKELWPSGRRGGRRSGAYLPAPPASAAPSGPCRSSVGEGLLVRRGYFNLIDLRFYFPAPDFQERTALEAARNAADSLLEKKTLACWIGDIEARPFAVCDEPLIRFDELPSAVERLIDDAWEELPDRPWHRLVRDVWSAVEGEPEQAEDYAGQLDLVAGRCALPWMWRNALSTTPFHSARYSRFGERFCYLKIDGAVWNHASFADREQIEETLDASLRQRKLGCVVGGGTGLRYSYIELALTDVGCSWRLMNDVLSAGRLPKRTWLLFHDADLASRWLGLYADTPLPPQRSND